MKVKHYKAEVLEPVFYSSREGTAIESNERVSSTALMHAIGYDYGTLEKKYLLVGEESSNPDYSHLKDTDFFCSDMEPIDVSVDEHTFRTVIYPEHSIVADGNDLAKLFGSSNGFPKRKGVSRTAWNPQRDYVGISPDSSYKFTIWCDDGFDIPDTLRFRVGIGKTGMIRAEVTEEYDEATLNRFLLDNVIDIDDVTDLVIDADKYIRDNDPRLHHIVNTDVDKATDCIKTHFE